VRLDREIRERGYRGGHTIVKDFVRQVRPAPPPAFERRFETAPGKQAQVDFAHFRVPFADQPDQERVVWLFSLVLGFSRYLFARFVPGQGMAEVVRCHLAAFAALDGVPREILYDRMKTAVLGEDEAGRVVFNENPARSRQASWLHAARLQALPRQDQGQGRAAVSIYPPGLFPGPHLPQPR
jgi:transposase